MTSNFQKPENALKRAEELVSVGQQQEALNVLHSTITHRKLRGQGWDLNAELVMLRHIRLCVELEKPKIVREGLHFYRYMTQQHNVLALAKAMKELRELSEKKLEAVKSRISAAAAVDVDDLEAEETPESLMLSTLQVEVRDKTAKELHTALLGCWESYKIIMDLLRYAPKIDYAYHETAQKALEFCRVNKRHQEFRRLCDTLRAHYQGFQKQRGRPELESFLRPETHLATRLTQLDVAADLCLWSQCFQTAEDILALGLHELLQRSLNDKESVLHKYRGLLLSQTSMFYEKLAMIFEVSDQPVFRASAVLRNLFHTRQHKKNVPREEQVRLCDVGTIAVLCVPLGAQTNLSANDLEYQRKLASMLGHGGIPTRASMKEVIEAQGIVSAASQTVQDLYALLEGDVNPLTICSVALEHIKELESSPALQSYIPSLKRVIFDKLILTLAKIYTSLSIDVFTKSLCPTDFISWDEAETIIVQLVHSGTVQLSLDYSRHAMIFGSTTSSPDSLFHNRLVQTARVLAALVPQLPGTNYVNPALAAREAFYADFDAKLEAETVRLNNRNQTVAERRKKQEADEQAKEEARRAKEKEKQKKEEQEELVRREAALKHQEDIRRKEEQQQLKLELARQIVAEFKATAEHANGKIVVKGKNIDEITPEDIINRTYEYEDWEKAQEELRNRERVEKGRQRRLETKRVEHLVRALRDEEAPLLEEWKQKTKVADVAFLEEVQIRAEEESKRAWEEAQELRQIFTDIKPIRDAWFEKQINERTALWEVQKKQRVARIKVALKSQKIQRARARRDEREEALRKEEEDRQREAEERQRAEAAEKKLAEERERQEALQRAAEKQRQKELEIEQRQQEERDRHRKEIERPAAPLRGGPSAVRRDDGPDDWRRNPPAAASTAGPTATRPTPVQPVREKEPVREPFRERQEPEVRRREPEPRRAVADDMDSWRRAAPVQTPDTRRRPETTSFAVRDSRPPPRETRTDFGRDRQSNNDVEFSRDQMRPRSAAQEQPRREAQMTNGVSGTPATGDEGWATAARGKKTRK